MIPGQLVPKDEDTLAMCNISNYSPAEMAQYPGQQHRCMKTSHFKIQLKKLTITDVKEEEK
jgi:hypothetical protein